MAAATRDPHRRLQELMDAAAPAVESFVRRKVPSGEAQDVTQDIWLRTYLSLPGWQGEGTDLALLWTVARRAVADHWRRESAHPAQPVPPEDVAQEIDLDEGLRSLALRDSVARIIETLPQRHREVLYARLVDGLPLPAIAGRFALPVGTVKSRLHHGRSLLRERLAAGQSQALCGDLAAAPLGLAWGLRSLASSSVVALHLATCPRCSAQWQHLERLTRATEGPAAQSTAALRVVLRIEPDLSLWIEGDLFGGELAGGLMVGAAAELGQLQRLSDDQERNWAPGMQRLPGGGPVPDRYVAEVGRPPRSGRMRFVHRIPQKRSESAKLIRRTGRSWTLRWENVPTYAPDLRIHSSVYVCLPAGARLRSAVPQPMASTACFSRTWLGFAACLGGGEKQTVEVRFSLG